MVPIEPAVTNFSTVLQRAKYFRVILVVTVIKEPVSSMLGLSRGSNTHFESKMPLRGQNQVDWPLLLLFPLFRISRFPSKNFTNVEYSKAAAVRAYRRLHTGTSSTTSPEVTSVQKYLYVTQRKPNQPVHPFVARISAKAAVRLLIVRRATDLDLELGFYI